MGNSSTNNANSNSNNVNNGAQTKTDGIEKLTEVNASATNALFLHHQHNNNHQSISNTSSPHLPNHHPHNKTFSTSKKKTKSKENLLLINNSFENPAASFSSSEISTTNVSKDILDSFLQHQRNVTSSTFVPNFKPHSTCAISVNGNTTLLVDKKKCSSKDNLTSSSRNFALFLFSIKIFF
jgi:hypothetical protein